MTMIRDFLNAIREYGGVRVWLLDGLAGLAFIVTACALVTIAAAIWGH